MDLLTTVMHEIGHGLGLLDTDSYFDRSNIMYAYLNIGSRHLPALNQAVYVIPGTITTEVFSVPQDIPFLPSQKAVGVYYYAVVNSGDFTEVCSQGTFDGMASVGDDAEVPFTIDTDDPDTPEPMDPTCRPVVQNGRRSLWLPFF